MYLKLTIAELTIISAISASILIFFFYWIRHLIKEDSKFKRDNENIF